MLLLVVKLHHLLEAPRFPPAFLENSFPINAVCFLHTEFSVEGYRLAVCECECSLLPVRNRKLKDACGVILPYGYYTDCYSMRVLFVPVNSRNK
jgi:hypothetical protein